MAGADLENDPQITKMVRLPYETRRDRGSRLLWIPPSQTPSPFAVKALPWGRHKRRACTASPGPGRRGLGVRGIEKGYVICRIPEAVHKKLRGVTSATTPVMGCEAEANVYLLRYPLLNSLVCYVRGRRRSIKSELNFSST